MYGCGFSSVAHAIGDPSIQLMHSCCSAQLSSVRRIRLGWYIRWVGSGRIFLWRLVCDVLGIGRMVMWVVGGAEGLRSVLRVWVGCGYLGMEPWYLFEYLFEYVFR